MSKHVPTLLGIVIILLVVLLVLGIYNWKLSERISQGGAMVGTRSGQALTGQQQAEPQISPSEALAGQGRGVVRDGGASKGRSELMKMPTDLTEAQKAKARKTSAEAVKEHAAEQAKKGSRP